MWVHERDFLRGPAKRADMQLMELRAPWYARLVGWILVAFGALNLAGLVVAMADSITRATA
jgi:hypothetical protein